MANLELDALVREVGLAGLRAQDLQLELEVYDRIGEWFVLSTAVSGNVGGRRLSSVSLNGRDGLSVDVTSGSADVRDDDYRGFLLLRPTGDEPVEVRASLGRDDLALAMATESRPVAFPIDRVPAGEQVFEAAGGGACASMTNFPAAEFTIEVRSAMPANVIPLSPTRRMLNWRQGLYFAYHPLMGLMRLQYNPDYRSTMELESRGSNGGFFPAHAENQLYFLLDFLDLGIRAFNKAPLRQLIDVNWPPYEEAVLGIEEPVEFYDVEDPSALVMTLQRQEMRLYDYHSLSVEILEHSVDDGGRLRLRWRVVNQAGDQVRTRWFLMGDFRAGQSGPEGNRLLGPAGGGADAYERTVEVDVGRSSLPQTVSLAVLTVSDAVLAGVASVTFSYPAR